MQPSGRYVDQVSGFSFLLSSAREELKKTVYQLAKGEEITPQAIGNWEKGILPGLERIPLIARLYILEEKTVRDALELARQQRNAESAHYWNKSPKKTRGTNQMFTGRIPARTRTPAMTEKDYS